MAWGGGGYWQHTCPDAPQPAGAQLPPRLPVGGTWRLGYSSLLVVPSPKTVQLCCLPCCLPPSPWSASPPTQDRPWGVRETSEDPRPMGKIKTKFQSWARGSIQRWGRKEGSYPDGRGSPGSWQGSGWSPTFPTPPPCRLPTSRGSHALPQRRQSSATFLLPAVWVSPSWWNWALVVHFLKLCVASWWTFKPLCTQIPGLGSVSSDWEPRGWNSGYVTLNACDLSTLSWRLG